MRTAQKQKILRKKLKTKNRLSQKKLCGHKSVKAVREWTKYFD